MIMKTFSVLCQIRGDLTLMSTILLCPLKTLPASCRVSLLRRYCHLVTSRSVPGVFRSCLLLSSFLFIRSERIPLRIIDPERLPATLQRNPVTAYKSQMDTRFLLSLHNFPLRRCKIAFTVVMNMKPVLFRICVYRQQ